MKIKLSICIPTYNFGNYIGETLSSIIDQIVPGVEIIVLDGASTDNTSEVVYSYQQKCNSLVYHKQDFKGGIDLDMAKVISLSHGEYCWLMSSDDTIKPGAIQRILLEIESGYDIYLCNRTECDINLVPFRHRYWLKKNIGDKVFNLHDNYELMDYLNLSMSLGAIFSYMSSIIFKKSEWDKVRDKEYAHGTCYGHVYVLLSFIHNHSILKYIREHLLLSRFGNDSFNGNGIFKRVAIDIDGYHKIADKMFVDNTDVKDAFKRILRRDYSLCGLVKIRAFSTNTEWQDMTNKLYYIGYSPSSVYICGLIAYCSRPVINNLIKLKQIIKRMYFLVFTRFYQWMKK